MNQSTPHEAEPRELPSPELVHTTAGVLLRELAERLIDEENALALSLLHAALVQLNLAGVSDNLVSLVELGEYVDVAIEKLEANASKEEIRRLPIRQLLWSDEPI